VWLGIGLALAVAPGPTCRTADGRVESVIAAKVRLARGTEYCQSRLYHTVDDLDGDGRDDFVMVFDVEAPAGGNDSVQYLAVFPSSTGWRPSVIEVGESGERFVDEIQVEDRRTVVLLTSEYVAGDPMCCPSGEGELRYRLVRGQVVPVPDEAPPRKVTRSSPRTHRVDRLGLSGR
jgi:hypothetical protein